MVQGRMGSYSITLGTFLELIILQTVKTDIPGCHFLETVNISSSQKLQNGSYLYQDIIVPANLTGQYDYITTEWELNQTVRSHLRGCVCRLKPCIWICCRFIEWDASNGKCSDGLMEQLSEINPFLKVTLSNGSVVKRNILKDFIVLRDQMQTFDIWEEHEFTILENGSILLNRFDTINFKGYDCLLPYQFTSGNTESIVVAFYHIPYYDKPLAQLPIKRKLMWLSEVFLVITIAVYLLVKKLRNLHGKCFICYMITTFMYFVLLLLKNDFTDDELCTLQGYLMYFVLIAKFSWLLAMSHQLWRGLASVNRAESKYSLGAYSIFAWGMPGIMTGVLFWIEQIWDADPTEVEWVSDDRRKDCYFKDSKIVFYFKFFPMLIIITLNTTLFILTTRNITRIKVSLKHFSEHEERTRNLNSRMQMYKVLFRLFILMDIQWSVRLSYVIFYWDLLFNICKYCDACIGLIIFIMCVLKRSTYRLMMESIRERRK